MPSPQIPPFAAFTCSSCPCILSIAPSLFKYPGVQPTRPAKVAALISICIDHSSSACDVDSIENFRPGCCSCATLCSASEAMYAMCLAKLSRTKTILAVAAVWSGPGQKRFGNPRAITPCSVETPSVHLSSSDKPLRPVTDIPARYAGLPNVGERNPVPRMRTSSLYSVPPTTTPFSVTQSTPLPSVSTNVTLGKLKVGK